MIIFIKYTLFGVFLLTKSLLFRPCVCESNCNYRALSSRSNYGSLPRPPAENRIKLYGLYKQATEGDVDGVMPRPVGFTAEDEGAKKKWDAWKREQG